MERIPSDNEAINTYDATVVAHGTRRRPALSLPQSAAIPVGEVIRVVLTGDTQTYFTQPEAFADDEGPRVTGIYGTPETARTHSGGEDRLRPWLEAVELTIGRTVHCDVIEPGYKYGLRAPGERTVYNAPGRPDEQLASIARDLDG